MTDVEKKPTTTKKATPNKKDRPTKSISSNALVSFFIFLLFIVTSGGLYWLWDIQEKNTAQQSLANQAINQQLKQINEKQQTFSQHNVQQIKSLQTFQETLRHNLTKIVQSNEYFQNDWLVSEAEYLIQLANYRLLLEKDVTTAMIALKAADVRLAEVADPALLKIRKRLKNDLQSLSNVHVIDLAGISITITALSNNIENLPLLTPDPKTHKASQTKNLTASSEIESIQQLPAAIWKDIKSLIVIRNHQELIKPLLDPEQHLFLKQNLALLFEQTRLALLNGNNVIYQERLEAIIKWVKKYFDPEHNITRNMLASIDSLQKEDINPTIPDISSTYSAVKKYRTQGQVPTSSTIKAKEK